MNTPIAGTVRDNRTLVGILAALTRGALTLAVLSAILLIAARPAQAQTETVLYNFCSVGMNPYCYDGAQPTGNLALDSLGNLYGTTTWGGAISPYGGTVFKVTPSGTETVLHTFTGLADGSDPYFAGVVFDKAGNIFGTTYIGGANNYGTVFKLTPTGTETVLHSFAGYPTDGSYPLTGVVLGTKGILYGATYGGGANALGMVFKAKAAVGSDPQWSNGAIISSLTQ